MDHMYNYAAELLWLKIYSVKDNLDISCLENGLSNSWHAFCKVNPMVKNLENQVNSELNYKLCYNQCTWAIKMIERGIDIDHYLSN